MKMLLLSLFCVFLSHTLFAAPLLSELKKNAAKIVILERDPDFVPVPVPIFIPPLPSQAIDSPAMPEPATIMLLGLGFAAWLRYRKSA